MPARDELPSYGLDAPAPEPNVAGGDPQVGSDLSNRPTVSLPLPLQRRPDRPGKGGAPLALAAIVNGLWAAVLTLLPVLAIAAAVTQIGSTRPAVSDTFRYGVATWLLAHGVPLKLSGYPIALVPLLITAFAWWRLVIAGRHTVRAVKGRGRASWSVTFGTALVMAMLFATLGFGASVLVKGARVEVGAARATLTLAVFAGLASGMGAGAATTATRRLWWRVPPVLRDGVRAGIVGAILLLGAGALATGVAVAVAGGKAVDMLHSYHTGVVGQVALVVICLAYAPNVSVWATAFLAGPGFTLAGVPALPVFAGLPARPLTGAAQWVLGIPVLAGAAGGFLLVRKRGVAARVLAKWHLTLLVAVVAGVLSAAALALVGYVAAGSLGVGLLAAVGQVGWQFPAIGGAGIAFGSLIGANAGRHAAHE
jgi:Family of unknown function (DUF6350)